MQLIDNTAMKPFWTADDNTTRLVDWLIELNDTETFSTIEARVTEANRRYQHATKEAGFQQGAFVCPTNIWKIMNGRTKKPTTFGGLTFIFCSLMDKARQSDSREGEIFSDLDKDGALTRMYNRLISWFSNNGIFAGSLVLVELSTAAKMDDRAKRFNLHGNPGAIWKTADNVRLIFQLQPFSVIDKAIFNLSPSDVKKEPTAITRQFEVFRNSNDPSLVSHMFCRLMSSSQDWTLPRFHLFFVGADGSQYESHGVIFASTTTIYLFGGLQLSQPDMPIKPGLAMGLVAIPMRSIDRRSFPGLQLGHDGVDQTFSAGNRMEESCLHRSRLTVSPASLPLISDN